MLPFKVSHCRHLLLLSIIVAVCGVGCSGLPKPPVLAGKAKPVKTGPFWWGASTSNYQIEDPDVKPGDKQYFQTDWDLYVKEGGAPPKGNATYSWTEFERDLHALKKAGVTHYRFGVEWARVEPKIGQYNDAAITRYVRMAKALKEAGIEPIVCLWHFTFPDWTFDGKPKNVSCWLDPDTDPRWDLYVTKMVKALAPYVRYYAPQNEPNGEIATAYLGFQWPPATVADTPLYEKALAASVKQFREAAAIIKKIRPDALVLSIEALPYWEKSLLDPGSAYYNEMERVNFDHLDRTYDVCDIIGFNYYYSQPATVLYYLTLPFNKGPKYTSLGWRIDPQALYKQIEKVGNRYGKPMMITENGIATEDDAQKIKYLREHIGAIYTAKKAGYDVRGYFVWTLVDNYEWHHAYTAKFGLFSMDPKTRAREERGAAAFYRELIRSSKGGTQTPAGLPSVDATTIGPTARIQ